MKLEVPTTVRLSLNSKGVMNVLLQTIAVKVHILLLDAFVGRVPT